MPFELFIARRYLFDRHKGAWGWLISLMATGSVALGVASLIVTLAVMTGFREDIRTKILGVQPHLFIHSFSGQMDSTSPALVKVLKANPHVVAWSPFVNGQVLIGRASQSSGALIKGIDPFNESRVTNLKGKLQSAHWSDLAKTSVLDGREHPRIFLGRELARQIGARLGEQIWIITPGALAQEGLASVGLSIPPAHLFVVSGFVQTGLYDYDSSLAYLDISSAQKLFQLKNKVSGMGVKLNDPDQAESVSKVLQKNYEGAYWVRSWFSLNKNLFSALKLEKTVMFIILTLVTLVASFMIVSNLLLSITQKVKDIGILRAMGTPSAKIRRIFLVQGCLMGLVGNAIGAGLGILLSLFLATTNIIRLPADVYYIDRLPIRIDVFDIVSVMLAAGLIIFIATLYPAQRATELDPLDAIRYG